MKSVNIKQEFADDFISREAGERLRNIILEATKNDAPVEIDFTGKIIASTSFFDEGFAKLIEHGWTKEKMFSLIKFKNIHKRDMQVLEDLFEKRLMHGMR